MTTNTHAFKNTAAQGDLLIRKVAALPEGLSKVSPVDERFILAHSETGHHHAVEADNDVELYADPKNDMRSYLVVKGIVNKMLEHHRSFDTHAPIQIPPGIYELRRQREYAPEGWRRVED